MFLLKLKGGLEITEHELGCWDNVPSNVEIVAVAFSLDRQGAKPYVIEYCGYEQYCCAHIGHAAQGFGGQCVGYAIIVKKHGVVLEHEILPDGMRLKVYPEDRCEVPERCFRRGVPL